MGLQTCFKKVMHSFEGLKLFSSYSGGLFKRSIGTDMKINLAATRQAVLVKNHPSEALLVKKNVLRWHKHTS